jgi:hypothetical protein
MACDNLYPIHFFYTDVCHPLLVRDYLCKFNRFLGLVYFKTSSEQEEEEGSRN